MKGSERIDEIIERLKNKGHAIDYVQIRGKPFKEVLVEIQKCDFVVDQVFSDTPMAGFAKESAWFGKPAVVGGYGFEILREFVSDQTWPPSMICQPDGLEKAILRLVEDVEYRKSLGEKAQRFVREKWAAGQVASRYLRLINGDVPSEWWFDPARVTYLEGAGQSTEKTRSIVQAIIERYGVESLQLSHRPALERAFVDFSQGKPKVDGQRA
jgi:hypothetical protein